MKELHHLGGDLFLVDKPEFGTKTIEANKMLQQLRDVIGDQEYANLLRDILVGGQPGEDEYVVTTSSNGTKSRYIFQLAQAITDIGFSNFSKNVLIHAKSLGSVFTDKQKEEIQEGRFRGLALGDAWSINGKTYRIVGFDWFSGLGNGGLSVSAPSSIDITLPHHVVIWCSSIGRISWKGVNNASGCTYRDSQLFAYLQPNGVYHTIAAGAFGDDWIVRHRESNISVENDDGSAQTHVYDNVTLAIPTPGQIGHFWPLNRHEYRQDILCNMFPAFVTVPYFHTWNTTGSFWIRQKHEKTKPFIQTGSNQISFKNESDSCDVACYFLLGKFK